jgi:hypothetical protein
MTLKEHKKECRNEKGLMDDREKWRNEADKRCAVVDVETGQLDMVGNMSTRTGEGRMNSNRRNQRKNDRMRVKGKENMR